VGYSVVFGLVIVMVADDNYQEVALESATVKF
jgi:hypothetical protein